MSKRKSIQSGTNRQARKNAPDRNTIKKFYSGVDPRHTRKRSVQTTISLSTVELKGRGSSGHQATEVRAILQRVAEQFTRSPQKIEKRSVTKSGSLLYQVTSPQLAVSMGEQVRRAFKKYKPVVTYQWSRDRLNKIVHVKISLIAPAAKSTPTKRKQPVESLHHWPGWDAWQERMRSS